MRVCVCLQSEGCDGKVSGTVRSNMSYDRSDPLTQASAAGGSEMAAGLFENQPVMDHPAG